MISSPSQKQLKFEKVIPVLLTLLILGVWEALSDLGIISSLFYPSPTRILLTFWQLLISGKLGANLEITLTRLGSGLILGMIPGVVLGFLMGWSRRLRVIIDPFIAALHPIPKTAIFPLVLIIFGIGESSKIFTIAIATFFPVLINSMAGVRQISPVYFEVANNYGATFSNRFMRVILPGSLPMVLVGIRIAFNNTLMITIALELLAGAGRIDLVCLGDIAHSGAVCHPDRHRIDRHFSQLIIAEDHSSCGTMVHPCITRRTIFFLKKIYRKLYL
jgi:ABC-type nitrate/sulfonate/bicarbonate transport system permease component